ncbi:MAG: efflux RND transporter periplasmic adaptor subunit [Planctomycetes bacterium]|nr:efflux RND transporter periplasmic adaptor subunit [Planctomycetota bacterium]
MSIVLVLCVAGAALLFVGDRYGARIGSFVQELWTDIFGGKSETTKAREGSALYTCGMHPWVILPQPGLCPICHMDLTPLDPSKFSGEISIDPVIAQNIGVRTRLVERGPLISTVRTVGKVDYDETSLHDVNLRVSGWIESLHVDFLGARVEAGQPLFELDSPELYQAQRDYLLALDQEKQPAVPFVPRIQSDAVSTADAVRARLVYFGIDDPQIDKLERERKASKTMTIKSPAPGTVVEKMAVDGMRVDPGMRMYRIANLAKVWVTATVYEYQLPFVELGQEATVRLSYVPGEDFQGRVAYVYPWTDEKTREVRVRLEFDNDKGLLKPGMFVNVELRRTLAAERTLVDRSAVIDTGERQVAIVSLGNGRFEPRDVRVGIETDAGKVEVLDGLVPGERVVTSAQFLLDSEAKIREGLARMVRGDVVGQEAATPTTGPELDSLPPPLVAAVEQIVAAYVRIGDVLASDRTTGLDEQGLEIATAVDAMIAVEIPGHELFWNEHDEVATVRGKAFAMAGSPELAEARLLFSDLSIALSKLLRATGVPSSPAGRLEELHCPMFLENQGGATWLQRSGDVKNPYFGAKMLSCFDERRALPPAGTEAELEKTSSTEEAALVDRLVTSYLKASAALAADSTEGLDASWAELRDAARKLGESGRAVADAVPDDGLSLDAVRKAFIDLSESMIALVRRSPAAQSLSRAYCPMVKAAWLQEGNLIRNPYEGSAMLECGRVEETLPGRNAEGNKR